MGRTILLWFWEISDAIGFWFWISNTVQLTRAPYQKDRAVMRGDFFFSSWQKKLKASAKVLQKELGGDRKTKTNNLIDALFTFERQRSTYR